MLKVVTPTAKVKYQDLSSIRDGHSWLTHPPATAGGTDLLQVSLWICDARRQSKHQQLQVAQTRILTGQYQRVRDGGRRFLTGQCQRLQDADTDSDGSVPAIAGGADTGF